MLLTKEEKINIVTRNCDNIKEAMLLHLIENRIPEEWDGIELQQWFVDIVKSRHDFSQREHSFSSKRSSRRKDYENELLIKPWLT